MTEHVHDEECVEWTHAQHLQVASWVNALNSHVPGYVDFDAHSVECAWLRDEPCDCKP
jgi:hypothetical protein